MLDKGIPTVLLDTDFSIASFGEDEAGEVYVISLTGAVYRLVNPDAPRLTLSVNQSAPPPGDTIRVRVGLGTGEAAVSAHLYFGVVLPDGLTAVFLTSVAPPAGSVGRLTDDARTFPPLIRAALIPAATDVTAEDVLVFALTGEEEPGWYVVFAALVRPGAFDDGRVDPGDVLASAQGDFRVSP